MLLQPHTLDRRSRPRSPSARSRSRSQGRVKERQSQTRSSLSDRLSVHEVHLDAKWREHASDNEEHFIVNSRRSRSPQAVSYERLSDTYEPIKPKKTRSTVGRSNNDSREDEKKYRYSADLDSYNAPKVYKQTFHETQIRNGENAQEDNSGASFKFELGGHNLFSGIHLKKSKLAKRFSLSDPSSLLGSKQSKEDPLAYGSFSVDHLAYPNPPSSRSHTDNSRVEKSRHRPSSIRHESPPAPATISFVRLPNRRHDDTLSPTDLGHRMQSLDVKSDHHGKNGASSSLASAPGSPLLEPYRGTYQSISPMPSPLLKPIQYPPSYNSETNYYSSADDRSICSSSNKNRRTARFHDPKEEASILAVALRDEKRLPDTEPLISILPGLTHIQILELRHQYKQLVRTGRDKKGVNIAKHIKLRLKDKPDLMKACYVCALGQWESEAYWANFWYQSQKNRRELLIESLMGRSNEEIRKIKDGFRDKKYHDSLTQCLQSELREDKFKKAVMLILEEKRMEERADGWLDTELINSDVQELRDAVKNKHGGESVVIKIVLLRSETHLRELLKTYNKYYGGNFAREILKKSENLVGELLAHILNGVINAPVRDALLLHHALTLPRIDGDWAVLLISRLVRYHWNRPYFERVRSEFRHLYKTELQTAVAESVSGDLGQFLKALCVRRTDGDVRILPDS